MYNVKLLNKIAKIGLNKLPAEQYNIGEDVASPDAVLVRSASMHEMELPESLLAIARAGAGVNNIPVDDCAAKGIVVFNTPGANANAVKELAIGALLLASRNIAGGIEWVKTLGSDGAPIAPQVEKGKGAFVGPELSGKTLGVIGLGAIGALVANAAHSLDMEVLGCDPYITVDAAWMLSRKIHKANDNDEIYANADYITLHIPATPTTKGMINKDTIAKMKDGVRIINLARADLVNSEDMKAALESGKVAAYVTDFPTNDMIGAKNTVMIPHLGASTPEAEDNCAVMACKELHEYLTTGNIKNSVNFPNVELPHTATTRICCLHKNVPSVITSITNVVSSEGLNIENLINRSKKDYAYTIFEIDGDVTDAHKSAIEKVEGMIKVRVI